MASQKRVGGVEVEREREREREREIERERHNSSRLKTVRESCFLKISVHRKCLRLTVLQMKGESEKV
jgi:hypothetical protein